MTWVYNEERRGGMNGRMNESTHEFFFLARDLEVHCEYFRCAIGLDGGDATFVNVWTGEKRLVSKAEA